MVEVHEVAPVAQLLRLGSVVGLISTSESDTVGLPVSRPWPGRGVRRKWWPVTPSGVAGAANDGAHS